ncbi:MAG TPA: hypothetical protein VFU59_01555, partial [Candidatus Eisenbacteria bacterium]|nr:hypothetical protein [Candidatus Eisenbacteria bacterium]
VCLVDLCTLPTAGAVDTLIRRLESIESRLGGGSGASGAGGGSAPRGAASDPPRAETLSTHEIPRAERRAAPPSAPPSAPSAVSQTALPRATPSPTPKPALGIVTSGEDLAASGSDDSALSLAPAPLGGDSDRWRFVVERVKERKLLLGTCLEEGFFIGVSGSQFTVALSPEHSFHKAMLEMKENRELIQQELERGFGRRLAFQCVVREAGPEQAAQRTRAEREAREALVTGRGEEGSDVASVGAGDSLVRRIVDLFDGEVVEAPEARVAAAPAGGAAGSAPKEGKA